jgi:hypothetical protein
MIERPIIFSGESIRAILDGHKTQTRRVIKPQPPEGYVFQSVGTHAAFANPERPKAHQNEWVLVRSPYGGVAENRLWVRETWRPCYCQKCQRNEIPVHEIEYRADGDDPHGWKPSIHMPRWASRITLRITAVRVERLQDIKTEDIKAEGVNFAEGMTLLNQRRFEDTWNLINGKRGYTWDSNPWVWVIEFEKVQP